MEVVWLATGCSNYDTTGVIHVLKDSLKLAYIWRCRLAEETVSGDGKTTKCALVIL